MIVELLAIVTILLSLTVSEMQRLIGRKSRNFRAKCWSYSDIILLLEFSSNTALCEPG